MEFKQTLNYFLKIILASFIAILLSACSKAPEKPDFSSIDNVHSRKEAFINYMLPFIYQTQKDVMEQRQRLETLQHILETRGKLSGVHIKLIKRLAKQYQISFNAHQLEEVLNNLLMRVNTIPTSMVLAQSALESGLGNITLCGQWQ